MIFAGIRPHLPDRNIVLLDRGRGGAGSGNRRNVMRFLHFSWQQSCLLSAIGRPALTFAWSYRGLRRDVGLTAFTPAQIVYSLAAKQLTRNIGLSRDRS